MTASDSLELVIQKLKDPELVDNLYLIRDNLEHIIDPNTLGGNDWNNIFVSRVENHIEEMGIILKKLRHIKKDLVK